MLFKTFQSANTPLVVLGTVYMQTVLPFAKINTACFLIILNCFHMIVSNRFGTIYREEEQKN
jgi:hypothetical protein